MTYDEVVAALRVAGCVFAEDEARLILGAGGDIRALVRRRVDGEPLEQVLGWADFAGVRVRLERGVFVPRQRTAAMVDEAVSLLAGRADPVVLDLCCGSGAVGLAVASRVAVRLHASDVEPVAVRCARENLAAVGGQVHQGDLFDALPTELRGTVDVLTCNLPYVPTDAIASMPPEARDHEPRVTLDGGPDGLDVLRRVLAAAPSWLAPGGSLLVEVSRAQAGTAAALADAVRLESEVVVDDERGSTLLVARHTAAMAYDEELADRLRDALGDHAGITEKKMFGGLAFLLHGNMAVSASSRGGLLLRVDPARTDELVDGRHVTRFEMRGREMDGWLHVDAEVVGTDEELRAWVQHGLAYAGSLPPK